MAITIIKSDPKKGVKVRIFNKANVIKPMPDIFIRLNSRSLIKEIQLTITTELITVAIRTVVTYRNNIIIVRGKPIIVMSSSIAEMGIHTKYPRPIKADLPGFERIFIPAR